MVCDRPGRLKAFDNLEKDTMSHQRNASPAKTVWLPQRLSFRLLRLLIGVQTIAVMGTTQAATLYVSPSGNDTAMGTATAPWRTLQRAVDDLKPGDTLLIGPGNYRERMMVRRGGTAAHAAEMADIGGAARNGRQGRDRRGGEGPGVRAEVP